MSFDQRGGRRHTTITLINPCNTNICINLFVKHTKGTSISSTEHTMPLCSSIFRKKKAKATSSVPVEQAAKTKSIVGSSSKRKSSRHKKGASSTSSFTETASLSSRPSASQQPKIIHKIREENAPVPKVIDNSRASTAIVKKFIDTCNRHDHEALRALFTEDALFQPEDVPPIPLDPLMGHHKNLDECFPDFQFTYTSIKKHAGGDGTVVVEGAHFSGTHTGAPYTAAPELPPLPANGCVVVNDEERWFFVVDSETGLIKSWSLISLGPTTGPMGAYEQIRDAM